MSGTLEVAGPNRGAAGVELRVSERFECDVPASCQPPSDWKRGGQKWTARVRDVSAGGLRLILGRRFERGAGLAIELPGPDADSPSILLARVMNVRPESNGTWALGCAFVSPLSDEELQALTRSSAVAEVFFRGRLASGAVVERRIRRLNWHGDWPLPAGRTIGLRLGGSVARVRVDACRPAGAGWLLECTLLETPPAGLTP